MIASCYWTHYVVTAQIHGMSEPPIGLPNKRSFTRSAFTICHLSYATTNLPNCIFPVVQLTKQVWSVPLLENSAPALWNVLCNTLYKRVVVLSVCQKLERASLCACSSQFCQNHSTEYTKHWFAWLASQTEFVLAHLVKGSTCGLHMVTSDVLEEQTSTALLSSWTSFPWSSWTNPWSRDHRGQAQILQSNKPSRSQETVQVRNLRNLRVL